MPRIGRLMMKKARPNRIAGQPWRVMRLKGLWPFREMRSVFGCWVIAIFFAGDDYLGFESKALLVMILSSRRPLPVY